MRKLIIACGLLFLGAASAKAQESRGFEISGNYQYVRFNPGGGSSGVNCQGGSGSFGAYLTSRIGVIGEFGGCKVTGLPSGTTAHELNSGKSDFALSISAIILLRIQRALKSRKEDM